MKELRGTATALVPASLAQCLALVEAVDDYPRWYPDVVRTVDVLERDAHGVPSRVRTNLRVSVGPLTKDFDLLMAVTIEPPASVKLVKIGGTAKFDVIWRLHDGQNTRVELDLDASLDVPRLLPLTGVGNSVAEGFVSAARAELARRTRGQLPIAADSLQQTIDLVATRVPVDGCDAVTAGRYSSTPEATTSWSARALAAEQESADHSSALLRFVRSGGHARPNLVPAFSAELQRRRQLAEPGRSQHHARPALHSVAIPTALSAAGPGVDAIVCETRSFPALPERLQHLPVARGEDEGARQSPARAACSGNHRSVCV